MQLLVLLNREIRLLNRPISNVLISSCFFWIFIICANFTIDLYNQKTEIKHTIILLFSLFAYLNFSNNSIINDLKDGTLKSYLLANIDLSEYIIVKIFSQFPLSLLIGFSASLACMMHNIDSLKIFIGLMAISPGIISLNLLISILTIKAEINLLQLIILPLIIPQIIFLSSYLINNNMYLFYISVGISLIELALTGLLSIHALKAYLNDN